ncbi:MAG: hypothetical protein H6733_12755 [Alphaproteobacteria bacterium]|nr:hypothetical protein [Alphaproteobacteria bacterium]
MGSRTTSVGGLPVVPLVAYLLGAAVVFGLILRVNAGVFTYTLDDPYVHLELARHLAHGEHGINDGVFSAPSSSILWPAVLVPAWWVGGMAQAVWWPLVLNVAAALLALAGLGAASRRILGDGLDGPARWLLLAMVLVANLVALTFTGMEHTLQVALATWLAVGLMDVDDDRAPPAWLAVVMVLLPLLRFECTGIVVLSAAWLVLRGHRATGIGVVAVVLASLAGFSAFVHAHSGFWLPFSVLSKNAMFHKAIAEAFLPSVFVPLGIAAFLVWRSTGRPWARRFLPGIAAAGVVGHMLIAQTGLFNRYLGYITVFAVLVLAWTEREALRARLAAGGTKAREVWWVVGILAVINVQLTLSMVGAAAHIWRMQGQMRHLAVDVLDAPVAVNDIGFVALDNPHEVIDLVGLATPEALQHRIDDDGIAWMDTLVEARGAKAILVFRHWFPRLPPGWKHVATLYVETSSFKQDDRTLWILAPRRAEVPALTEALQRWKADLPDGVVVRFEDDAG